MPVTPPYGIIDSIARLRASGGAAWGDAAKSIGQTVGQTATDLGKFSAAKTQAATARSQQLTDEEKRASDEQQHTILSPIFQNNDIVHSSDPSAKGLPTMADAVGAAGGRVMPQMKDLALKPKLVEKSQLQIATAQAREDALNKIPHDKISRALFEQAGIKTDPNSPTYSKQELDAAMKKLVTEKTVAGREKTADTAAKGKTDAATIAANAKKSVADINARLKSPDHAIQLQAMKDRDAYIIKNPATSGLFGTPADIGKTPAKGAAPAPAGGDASDLDALMVKHGGS